MAFTGAQIAAMTTDIVRGPEKKEKGGEITGGSGQKDDVPIMAMGGEFMMRKSAVKKYGVPFMKALNEGMIPRMDFAIPDLPSTNTRGFYSGGGEIGSANALPITVNLKNESGHDLKQTKSSVDFNGQEYIINVVIDAAARNVGGFRDMLRG